MGLTLNRAQAKRLGVPTEHLPDDKAAPKRKGSMPAADFALVLRAAQARRKGPGDTFTRSETRGRIDYVNDRFEELCR